jgi:hypothetical protein
MSNSKISALTSATTPLAGTEVLPIVQSSTTKQVSVANLTAGRAISALSVTSATVGATTGAALSLQADGATKATVATTGNFLLGSASEIDTSFRLQVTGAGGSISSTVGTNATSFRFISANTTSQWSFGNNSPGIQNSGDYFAWNRLPNGGSWSELLRLDSGGNLIPGVAAKGINFTANTPAAGMTSQLMNWYEEGTWTPNQGAGLTVVGAFSSTGLYTRIGRQVTVTGRVTGATSINTSGSGIVCTNLPFTVGTNSNSVGVMTNTATNNTNVYVNPGTATMYSSMASGVSGSLFFTVTYSV